VAKDSGKTEQQVQWSSHRCFTLCDLVYKP
jgi:hypothetical protein